MNKKRLIIIVVIGGLVLGGLGYYILYGNLKPQPTPESNNTAPSTEANKRDLEPIIKIEPLDDSLSKAPVPNLARPITFPEGMTEDKKKNTEAKIREIIARLQKNKYSYEDWIELGIYRKSVEDYKGTEEAWEFAGLIKPSSALAFGNLGNLYGYDIKNQAKAEESYLRAIKNEPKLVYWYVQLAEYYRDIAKDNSKARAILERAMSANPEEAEELKKYAENLR